MGKGDKLPDGAPSQVDAFLRKVAESPVATSQGKPGRLMFAMDATASRDPTWDRASGIQGEMFEAASALGGLEMQLVFFRGFGEFKVSPWLNNPKQFLRLMSSVFCAAGQTQIAKVLQHAVNESAKQKVNALVYVGDCIEEDVDMLGTVAGQMGLIGVPAFIFHEGGDTVAAYGFQEIARLSGGAYCAFDVNSAHALRDLLSAVAAYAAGGRQALEHMAKKKGGDVLKLTHQIMTKEN